jgi:bis(5'-nucleosyl)-tetraphosphatase (symmetrical)
MSTYAIGDIQGCYEQLQELLTEINFDTQTDYLWFAGDLVNRGPLSLDTLRFVKSLGEHAITVLGNHDLHLLAVAGGHVRQHKHDHINDILKAPDRNELLDWLANQPLIHHDKTLGFTMIHAGMPPDWDLQKAQQYAAEVEQALQGDQLQDFLAHMYGNHPDQWSEDLEGWDRLRYIINCFSRLRYCDENGKLCLGAKGAPGTQPEPFQPWFTIPGRKSASLQIIFGHWSTLGKQKEQNIFPLDTGCLWGNRLTAMRLEDKKMFSVPCPAWKKPKG